MILALGDRVAAAIISSMGLTGSGRQGDGAARADPLIGRISIENPLWGAPRIHSELLKLGADVAQSSVAKYMIKRRVPPSQGLATGEMAELQECCLSRPF
jgi:hypothetical protein